MYRARTLAALLFSGLLFIELCQLARFGTQATLVLRAITDPEEQQKQQEQQEQQEQHQHNDTSNLLKNKNLHENFPLQCGELPHSLNPAIEPILDLYYNDREASPRHQIKFNEGGHNTRNGHNTSKLTQTQVCLYDVLHRWKTLADQLGITQWATHGGSAMGAKCFGALSPWDDDIDLTVANCSALDNLYETSPTVEAFYPDIPKNVYSANNSAVIFEARLLLQEGLILTKGYLCCPWYKLMTVEQAFLTLDGDDIPGIDIECMTRGLSKRERKTKREANWIAHMNRKGILHDVMFGPTTIRMVPPDILKSYITLRYGKQSPCRYPYANGGTSEPVSNVTDASISTSHTTRGTRYATDIQKSNLNEAMAKWYIPKQQRQEWLLQAGNGKQQELTNNIPNLNHIEVDNTISAGCDWTSNNATLKVIGWNAERGKYWFEFLTLVGELDALKEPYVILLNEMDIGMARSNNVHTARRLALELGMNYAFGLEFVELTSGTQEEQNATAGQRDALSLHGNAILSRCFLGDTKIIRDPLPSSYFSNKAVRGINANGYEKRLGGRMGIFARIFQEPPILFDHHNTDEEIERSNWPPHFVVGNVHKLGETNETRHELWNYYGFGSPPINTTMYDGKGIDLATNQLGVIVQGDFGPQFCSLGGLNKLNNYRIHKTFPVRCHADRVDFGKISGDFFCSNMRAFRDVQVSAPCYYFSGVNSQAVEPLTLSDHAIVSIVVEANKNLINDTVLVA